MNALLRSNKHLAAVNCFAFVIALTGQLLSLLLSLGTNDIKQ